MGSLDRKVLRKVVSVWPYSFHACSSPLQWRHNERGGVLNHRRPDCLLSRLFCCSAKKTSELRVTGFCEGNSPVTDEFPAEGASNADKASIWWRHHA